MILSEKQPVLEDIAAITAQMEEAFEVGEVPMPTTVQFSIAIDEIYSNIVYYSGAQMAKVECSAADGVAMLRFTDDGSAYDPMAKEDPDVTKSAEERGIGGLGIFLVKKFMDAMQYERVGETNVLTMTKNY